MSKPRTVTIASAAGWRSSGQPLPRCQEATITEAPNEECRRAGVLMTDIHIGVDYPVCLGCSAYYAAVRKMTDTDRLRWLEYEAR